MHQEWVAHLQAGAGIVADHIPHELPIGCKETLSLLFVPLIWPSTPVIKGCICYDKISPSAWYPRKSIK